MFITRTFTTGIINSHFETSENVENLTRELLLLLLSLFLAYSMRVNLECSKIVA